jgi:hypothetical protein
MSNRINPPTATIQSTLSELREQHEAALLRAELVQLESFTKANELANRVVLQEAEWGEMVNRREYLSDTPGFGNAGGYDSRIANAQDKKDGKCYPIYETEQDLASIRGIGRYLADFYGTGANILETLAAFVIGTGYTYEIHARNNDSKDVFSPEKCKEIQLILEEFLCFNGWQEEEGGLESELFKRARKEGEYFLWVHDTMQEFPAIDIVDPDYITEPRDPRTVEEYADLEYLNWKFGIASQVGRAKNVKAYFVQWEGDPNNWDVVQASEMVHCKLNVDTGVKRGISDFFCGFTDLEQAVKTLRNTQQGAAIQATIAYIR